MRNISVVITVDDMMGLAFNKRRQSRDSKLIEDLIKKATATIYITNYSLPLFEGYEDKISVVEDPIRDCPDGACCFIEMTHIGQYLDEIGELIVYRWNRLYPSDKKLDVNIDNVGFKMASKYEFVGSSHDKITKGIYKK